MATDGALDYVYGATQNSQMVSLLLIDCKAFADRTRSIHINDPDSDSKMVHLILKKE